MPEPNLALSQHPEHRSTLQQYSLTDKRESTRHTTKRAVALGVVVTIRPRGEGHHRGRQRRRHGGDEDRIHGPVRRQGLSADGIQNADKVALKRIDARTTERLYKKGDALMLTFT